MLEKMVERRTDEPIRGSLTKAQAESPDIPIDEEGDGEPGLGLQRQAVRCRYNVGDAPSNDDNCVGQYAREHDMQCILPPYKARVEKREPRYHKEHQEPGEQDE